MKKSIIAISGVFNGVADYELQRLVVTEWKKERSISGIIRYIVKNFDSVKPLKELLLRKGYKKADFGTANEPNFSFVLSHMSDKAKYQFSRVPSSVEGAKYEYIVKVDETGAKLPKLTYQLGSVLSELRKIENVTIQDAK